MKKNELKISLLKLFTTIGSFIYFLSSKVDGIFILSILLYFFYSALGLEKPFSGPELILWLDQLPNNSKTAIFTSIITIIGFLVAFKIGSTNQKQQILSQMKIEASNDIEKFINNASRNASSVNIYAKYLIEIANYINNCTDDDFPDRIPLQHRHSHNPCSNLG